MYKSSAIVYKFLKKGHFPKTLVIHTISIQTGMPIISATNNQICLITTDTTQITLYFPFHLIDFKDFSLCFSQFFSSFLQSTCLLSVSLIYLALWEIYPTFHARVPTNITLWPRNICCTIKTNDSQDYNLLWCTISDDLVFRLYNDS